MSRSYRGPSAGAAFGVFVVGLLIGLAFSAVGGWLFMLAVGAAHAGWLTTMPTVRFGTAWLIVILLTAAFKLSSIDVSSDD